MIPIHPVFSKQALRDEAKQKRRAIPEDEIAKKSARICAYLLEVIDGCDPVMAYVSKPPEVDTHPFIRDLLREGRRVVVPIIEKETRTLRLSYLRDTTLLVKSTFHVPEPIGNEIPDKLPDIQTVIIPLLAFDRRGTGWDMVPAIMTVSSHKIPVSGKSVSHSPARRQIPSRETKMTSALTSSSPRTKLSTAREN